MDWGGFRSLIYSSLVDVEINAPGFWLPPAVNFDKMFSMLNFLGVKG